MAKVGIVMGSDSDLPIMEKAAAMLEKFGIEYEMTIISAHRMPDVFFDYANTAVEKGFEVIIAGAGGAAHLPGMCAAIFPLPVIGVPIHTKALGGDSSVVIMELLQRSDALGHSGCNGCHRRRRERGYPCGQDHRNSR